MWARVGWQTIPTKANAPSSRYGSFAIGHWPLALLREQERDRVVSAACPYLFGAAPWLIHCNTIHFDLKARFAFTRLPGKSYTSILSQRGRLSTTVTCAVVNFKSAIAPLSREVAEISAIMAGFLHKLNTAVAGSIVGRYFRLEGSGHVRTIVG